MTDKTARIITLCAAAATFAYSIAGWMGALQSRAWTVVPLAFSAWMFWFAWRAHRAMKAAEASGHSAAE